MIRFPLVKHGEQRGPSKIIKGLGDDRRASFYSVPDNQHIVSGFIVFFSNINDWNLYDDLDLGIKFRFNRSHIYALTSG